MSSLNISSLAANETTCSSQTVIVSTNPIQRRETALHETQPEKSIPTALEILQSTSQSNEQSNQLLLTEFRREQSQITNFTKLLLEAHEREMKILEMLDKSENNNRKIIEEKDIEEKRFKHTINTLESEIINMNRKIAMLESKICNQQNTAKGQPSDIPTSPLSSSASTQNNFITTCKTAFLAARSFSTAYSSQIAVCAGVVALCLLMYMKGAELKSVTGVATMTFTFTKGILAT